MGAPKGNNNNPKGRPIGSQNRDQADIREKIKRFIEANIDRFQEDFNKLEPAERLMFLERLLKYSVAPLASIIIDNRITMERDRVRSLFEPLEQSDTRDASDDD